MRRVKIVCTIGPKSSDVDVMKKMIDSGMNVARINMSHGDHATHAENIKKLREAAKKSGKEIGILMDLQGPKIRVEKLKIQVGSGWESTTKFLKQGDIWYISTKNPKDYQNFIPTSYGKIYDDTKLGNRVLFDDGLIEAQVIGKESNGKYVKIKIHVGGELKSNKGINLPDSKVSAPSLTQKDKEDLLFGLNQDIDFIALSFVRESKDILRVKEILRSKGKNIPIISKIEKPEAVQNIESIIDVSDGIMIARGDMAVEMGAHLVPRIQKQIIIACNKAGKPVITATQMLESMTYNMSPTRAEASDVANAVLDGTDAVMLSGETATGVDPVNVIRTMNRIAEEAELMPKKRKNTPATKGSFTSNIQLAGVIVSENINAKAIISVTEKGSSSQKLSSLRPRVKVLAITNSLKTMRLFSLMWGVKGVLTTKKKLIGINIDKDILKTIKKELKLVKGDSLVYCRAAGKEKHSKDVNYVKIEQIK
jgi:pyruvate kinase